VVGAGRRKRLGIGRVFMAKKYPSVNAGGFLFPVELTLPFVRCVNGVLNTLASYT
jgi:hypothetical protein